MGNRKYRCIRPYSHWPFVPGQIYTDTSNIDGWVRLIIPNDSLNAYNFNVEHNKFYNSFKRIEFQYGK
jgi:hypothetical protein